MKTTTSLRYLSYTAIALFMFVASCKDNETIDFNSNDNSTLQSEANADAQLEEISSMGFVALESDQGTLLGSRSSSSSGTGPRTIIIDDPRFACAEITIEFDPNDNVEGNENTANPHGTITIDFGDGCTGPHGRVRKGKIIIEFKGRRFIPGSFIRITFDNFSVDGVKVEGTRTETNVTESNSDAPKMHIEEVGMKVTYLDGSFATRNVDRTRTWIRAASPADDRWEVTGVASGLTRKGREYVVTITKTLVFTRECALETKVVIPVEGTKEIVSENKKITIDFGNGECDTKVTITINGRSKEVEVTASGD